MSSTDDVRPPRVAQVAAGVESVEGPPPRPDARHEALQVLIGKWINDGHTVATTQAASVPILTSDTYEWAPGGFFVVHSAFGKIGETSVGGLEVIGVDGRATVTDRPSMTASVTCTCRGSRSTAT